MRKDSKTFYIKHDKEGFSVQLETNLTKFKSLERLLYLISGYFLKSKRVDQLETIIELISLRIQD